MDGLTLQNLRCKKEIGRFSAISLFSDKPIPNSGNFCVRFQIENGAPAFNKRKFFSCAFLLYIRIWRILTINNIRDRMIKLVINGILDVKLLKHNAAPTIFKTKDGEGRESTNLQLLLNRHTILLSLIKLCDYNQCIQYEKDYPPIHAIASAVVGGQTDSHVGNLMVKRKKMLYITDFNTLIRNARKREFLLIADMDLKFSVRP
ncbi:hypothetical protein K501DRAFT_270772 [Backusella circina FSU 941]|nr:hypothetical protein K501DRAFT_270772 [Backusella circina FSU 941]